MIVILTADIINSRKLSSKKWIDDLKALLLTFGKFPNDWEIYRGDEFQMEIKNPEDALFIAFQIKAFFKSINLDVSIVSTGEAIICISSVAATPVLFPP